MGAVYLGYHEGEASQVAVKVLAETLTSNQAFVDRFYREAKSGKLLNHPNIVRTLDYGQDIATEKHYLVLEFVDGPSAQAFLEARGPMAVGDAVHVTLDVARGLEHAHSRNVVHRDIKPDNILLARSGIAKLSDLGLAKRVDETSHLTATRQGFGTTAYMPYEQAVNARKADGRSDIYALGATLYHLVTGKVPFPGDNHLDVVEKKKAGDFTPAGELNAAVPRVLDEILARMLARDPQHRFQTVSELIVDLERSRLAARVPEYADPDQALQDPWVRARLAPAQQTRPDLEARKPTPANGAPVSHDLAAADVWLLRYRNKAGRMCKARVRTGELIERLRAGRLPAEVEARRAVDGAFRPLRTFAEFRGLTDPKPVRATEQEHAPDSAVKRWLIAGAILLAMTAGALITYFLRG